MHLPIVGAAMLALCATAAGGAQLSAPDSTDLHASYCVEIAKTDIALHENVTSSIDTTRSNNVINNLVKRNQAELDAATARLSKLQQYLQSRNAHVDPNALLSARSSALQDLARYRAAVQDAGGDCPSPAENADRYVTCVQEKAPRVMSDFGEIQQRLNSCRNLDWLPN